MVGIKGMEIPKCCISCQLYVGKIGEGYCAITHRWNATGGINRLNDCPLVEIVTCKDCECCRFELVEGIPYYWCDKDNCATSEDYYCGGGRRE